MEAEEKGECIDINDIKICYMKSRSKQKEFGGVCYSGSLGNGQIYGNHDYLSAQFP